MSKKNSQLVNGTIPDEQFLKVAEVMESTATSSSSVASTEPTKPNESSPPCVLVLGMAGSGKSSFVQRLTAHLHAQKRYPYVVNLDPAVAAVHFPANIDIRDSVNYKAVMRDYGLGPNGAIMTCLNLICTRFDQVLDLLQKRTADVPYFIFDTPGQIEAFTWSASGSIITDTLASTHPTVIAYVVDTARAANPTTFMSNMLYACSILFRTKLPFFLVFNKSDVINPQFAKKWMTDFEAFHEDVQETNNTYMGDFTRSLSLVLDSFYANLKNVTVSSRTGEGMEEVLKIIDECKKEYFDEYRPMYEKLREDIEKQRANEPTEKLSELTLKERDIPHE
ncbi:GPN-loop GTPase [Aphelenchoides besseyi]|nr:GPN-loop GTPase [Aphelenchoides besseyi]KAI6207932.1 GPN-loop GTPase [Aphelenchoides besseyi]